MLLAAFEPGQEMAIANFFLAIFCLFTIALPLLLITRGDKTQSNRDFLSATVNPWSQINKQIELTPVVISEFTSSIEAQPQLEVMSQNNDELLSETEGVISLDTNTSEEQEKTSVHELETNAEVLAA